MLIRSKRHGKVTLAERTFLAADQGQEHGTLTHAIKEPPTKYRLKLSRNKMCSHLLKEKTSKHQLVTDQ